MDEIPLHPTHAEAEDYFRSILAKYGFAQPDEVRHWRDPDEVVFMWHEQKAAIVIELTEEGTVDLRGVGGPGELPPV